MAATLYGVLKQNKNDLVQAWTRAVTSSLAPVPLPRAELVDRMPQFVDDIIRALHPEALPLPPSSGNAEEHGAQRFRMGFDVAEVVREYGLLHECILDVAERGKAEITAREHRLIVRWLNMGVADALAQYVDQRDAERERQTSEHLGFIAHELRNPLGVALGGFRRLRGRELDAGGHWVETVERNLVRMSELIDNTLNDVALRLGMQPRLERVDLATLARDLKSDLGAEAHAKGIEIVTSVESGLAVNADLRLLRSAASNLLHNAIKFSHDGATVSVTAKRVDDRVLIEVADGCRGLPPGRAEELFTPFVQRAQNRAGYGLGLAIALQAAEAHNGTITVRNAPAVGCAFTISLPAASDAG
jgi:signal transduction histidine kinase